MFKLTPTHGFYLALFIYHVLGILVVLREREGGERERDEPLHQRPRGKGLYLKSKTAQFPNHYFGIRIRQWII
jgi:hypothetical protein